MMDFNLIYKQHYKSVLFMLRRIVKNELDAEELASEAMIRVHKNLASYDGNVAKLSTWIFNIAKNAAIDFLRKKKLNSVSFEDINVYRDEESDVDHMMALKESTNNPEERMIEDEVRTDLIKHFNSLNKVDKLVATLHYFDGLSYEEVATELEMPLGTVKAKLHRARVVLMEAFPQEMRRLSTIHG